LKRNKGLFQFFPVINREERLEEIRLEGQRQRDKAPDAIEQVNLGERLGVLEKQNRKREQDRNRKRAQRLREKAKVRPSQIKFKTYSGLLSA
jgi:hypothetical protein